MEAMVCGGPEVWEAVTSFCEAVMLAKEEEKRLREQLAADLRLRSERRAAGSSLSDQDSTRVDGVLCSTRASRNCQQLLFGPDIGPIICRGHGIRSNETPPTSALGQLKERTGFLVSRSRTLPAAQPDELQTLFDDFPCT